MERWTKLQAESDVYIMRLQKQPGENADESTITFMLCDFKSLWNETVSNSELFKRVTDKNPDLDMTDQVIKDQMLAAVDAVVSMKEPKVTHKDDHVDLDLNYLIFGEFEVKFQWSLKKCGPQECFEHFTKLMMRQMGAMQEQNKRLVLELKKKDDEIGQYQLEYGQQIQRKRFITEPFEEHKFPLKCNEFNCGMDEFESVIGSLPKNDANYETKALDESCNTNVDQPTQSSTVAKHTSPKGKRPSQRRPTYSRAPLIKTGEWKYEDDDDDDGDKDGNTSIESKRSRQSY